MPVESYEFPSGTDQHLQLAQGGEAFFGLDVLRGLVGELRQAATRRRTARSWGPGVLGCSLWLDDPELIRVLGDMANVCVVVTKQVKKNLERPNAETVRRLAETNGLAPAAFGELAEFVARVDAGPLLVGPQTPAWTMGSQLGAVREVGFRRSGNHLVPLVHAKMALLGQMQRTDEHPSGVVGDHIWFQPEKLWIGSANFTGSSRRSLEMGLWTLDRELIEAARRFLLTLITMSEPLGAGPNVMEPELAAVEFDDAEFYEYMREFGLEDPPDAP